MERGESQADSALNVAKPDVWLNLMTVRSQPDHDQELELNQLCHPDTPKIS